jgi:hypothetical protein
MPGSGKMGKASPKPGYKHGKSHFKMEACAFNLPGKHLR